jgi:DNA-binding NarL/FixJ family response regulator
VKTKQVAVLDEADTMSVLLVDDYELLRSALRLLLESEVGCEVHDVASAEEAVAAVGTHDYDVVLLDVCMPEHDGLWTLRQIKTLRPELPVIMLSHFGDADYVRASLDAGAAGYVVKEADVDQVKEAIRTAMDGRGVYVHPVAASELLAASRYKPFDALTPRESDVLRLLIHGTTNEEIATQLFVTEKTVKTHLSAIFRKLGVSNRTQAATTAVQRGLIEL